MPSPIPNLTDHAKTGYGPDFKSPPEKAPVTQITQKGVTLNKAFLDKITNDGKGVILIDGRTATDQPLVLEITKNGKPILELTFPIKIAGIDQMFRTINLRPDKQGWPTNMDEPKNLPDEELAESNGGDSTSTSSSAKPKYLFFVHGYNVNSDEAKGWQAETFKHFWWAGSKARFVGVTWQGADSQIAGVTTNYHANVIHAFDEAKGLDTAVRKLGDATVYVAAHSLGNMLVSAAISDYGTPFKDFYMVNAAVAMEAYDKSIEAPNWAMWHYDWVHHADKNEVEDSYDPKLLCSNWCDLFPASDYRSKLTRKDRLADTKSTRYFNFYSGSDNVLVNHEGGEVPSVGGASWQQIVNCFFHDPANTGRGRFGWAYQEKLKGLSAGNYIGSGYGGWGYNLLDWGVVDLSPIRLPLREPYPSEVDGVQRRKHFDLKTTPFFYKGFPSQMNALLGRDGSKEAKNNQTKYLAEMVPALSFAAGANPVEKFTQKMGEVANFEMPVKFQNKENGWPRKQPDWLHSDMFNVAYPYIYKLYDEIVKDSALNK